MLDSGVQHCDKTMLIQKSEKCIMYVYELETS